MADFFAATFHLRLPLSLSHTLRRLLRHLRQAFLKCSHKVNHWSKLSGFLDSRDLTPFHVGLDKLLEIILEGIVILLGLELSGERLDQLMGNLDLGIFQF